MQEESRLEIDFRAWHESLISAIWWYKVTPEFSYHLYKNTKRAYDVNADYYFQGLENIELTKIYEQCKLLSILSNDYN